MIATFRVKRNKYNKINIFSSVQVDKERKTNSKCF